MEKKLPIMDISGCMMNLIINGSKESSKTVFAMVIVKNMIDMEKSNLTDIVKMANS